MGGTPFRMEKFAYYILQEIGFKICPGTMLHDLSAKSHRYALFKVGPVMSVSVSASRSAYVPDRRFSILAVCAFSDNAFKEGFYNLRE
jgi:hypothetical protein